MSRPSFVLLQALLLIVAFTTSRSASADELTDSWWVPDESGWGLNVVHQGNLLTIALYVHGADGESRWYTGALQRYGSTADGDPAFAGSLHETRGSAIGVPWNGAATQTREVGTIAFRARPGGRAELEYRVDGVGVRKDVQRFGLRAPTFSGLHFAMLLPIYDSCPFNFVGLRVMERGLLYVQPCEACDVSPESGIPVTLNLVDGEREICHIDGTFRAQGSSGEVEGHYRCDDGGEGPIRLRDIEFDSSGFTARFVTTHPQCGEFGGILSAVRGDARRS